MRSSDGPILMRVDAATSVSTVISAAGDGINLKVKSSTGRPGSLLRYLSLALRKLRGV